MKSRQRRSFSAEMKARIALEPIKGQKTIQEIASHYGVHSCQVTNWKSQAIQGSPSVILSSLLSTTERCLSKKNAEGGSRSRKKDSSLSAPVRKHITTHRNHQTRAILVSFPLVVR